MPVKRRRLLAAPVIGSTLTSSTKSSFLRVSSCVIARPRREPAPRSVRVRDISSSAFTSSSRSSPSPSSKSSAAISSPSGYEYTTIIWTYVSKRSNQKLESLINPKRRHITSDPHIIISIPHSLLTLIRHNNCELIFSLRRRIVHI